MLPDLPTDAFPEYVSRRRVRAARIVGVAGARVSVGLGDGASHTFEAPPEWFRRGPDGEQPLPEVLALHPAQSRAHRDHRQPLLLHPPQDGALADAHQLRDLVGGQQLGLALQK